MKKGKEKKTKQNKSQSLLSLFNDFHSIERKIEESTENDGNQTLLCVDCSHQSQAANIMLNLGISYANEGFKTLVLVNDSSSNGLELSKQILVNSDDVLGEISYQTRVENLNLQRIGLMNSGTSLNGLINNEKIIRDAKKNYERILLFLDAQSLSDDLIKELSLLSDSVILAVSKAKTKNKDMKRTVAVLKSAEANILGYVWVE